jgi:membrane protease YdiL (CAAX protease family)
MKMSPRIGGRTWAYLEFIAAVVYYFIAHSIAQRSSARLSNEAWSPLTEQSIFLFLLLFGFAAFGLILDRQKSPLSEQGLPLRPGWLSEMGLGIATGWAASVACVLILTIAGGIAVVLSVELPSWAWLLVDAVFFAVAALAEEVAFRGYGFQRFVNVVGPVGATFGFACFYAVVQALQPGSSKVSIAVSIVFNLVLSTAYLRTRALWLSWGLNFGWKASRALIFGLAVSGISGHSSVVEGDPMGPFWITGGGYGLDGSWVALFVLFFALPVVYRITRDLDFRYNAPVIIPGGVPVDLDAAARRQHEANMGPVEASAPSLVQILPAASPAESNGAGEVPRSEPAGTHGTLL